jgi:NAD-dependent SIR2 family protein deacetylase
MPPSDEPYDLVVKCTKCGERWTEQLYGREVTPLAMRCPTCGATSRGTAHWGLGNLHPIVVLDQNSEILTDAPRAGE